MKWIVLMCILVGVTSIQYAQADCYPGDTIYTNIVQEIYKGVTTDTTILDHFTDPGTCATPMPIDRQTLCAVLVSQHNFGKNSDAGQTKTNKDYLANGCGQPIPLSTCVNALTYTQGYSASDWEDWAGQHSGYWYQETRKFQDDAEWFRPNQYQTYALQPVRFDSQDRINDCTTPDMTGATCRFGWNQSGLGVHYLWGWDPKDNYCPPGNGRGRRGAVVGFPFSHGSASCIVWVTIEEAFLECVANSRRTSTSSGPAEGYGQWEISK